MFFIIIMVNSIVFPHQQSKLQALTKTPINNITSMSQYTEDDITKINVDNNKGVIYVTHPHTRKELALSARQERKMDSIRRKDKQQ